MAQTGRWPVDLVEAGVGSAITDKAARYVQSIDVTNGTITVMYGRDANTKINNMTLSIQPMVNTNGDVVWVCGMADNPTAGSADPDGGGAAIPSPNGVTNLLDKWMPASCRTGFGGL
jgi:hypothetical protein